jgi:hypothetical protein
MLVRAIQKCFVDNKLREAGQEFEHTGEVNPSVMVVVEDEVPVDKPVAKKAKKTAKKAAKKD